MTNPITIGAIFLGPLAVILILFLAARAERRRGGGGVEPGFFQRNGAPVAIFLLVAVGFWALFLIVFPQLYMIDYSFHPRLPQVKRGGPDDVYTLENYRYFLFGSTRDASRWNTTHLHAFWITIFVSVLITIANFAICYSLAYFMAQVARPRVVLRLMLLLIVHYWINEVLRAFAFRVLMGTCGVINNVLIGAGLIREPIEGSPTLIF
jgi:spermidine/putrescine transport system permease protein